MANWIQEMNRCTGPSAKDSKLAELARRYHKDAEAYDRTVCSGFVVNGTIFPATRDERALVNANARKLPASTYEEAERFGITREEMRRAIGRAA